MNDASRIYRDCCNLLDLIQEAEGKASYQYLQGKKDTLLEWEYQLSKASKNWYNDYKRYKFVKTAPPKPGEG